jgi:hypothetical protein
MLRFPIRFLASLGLFSIVSASCLAQPQVTPNDATHYAAVKALVVKLVTEAYPVMFEDRGISGDNTISLRPCDGWSDGTVTVENDRATRNLVDVVGYITEWRLMLSYAGFPEAVWKDRLQTAEANLVRKAYDKRSSQDDFFNAAIKEGRGIAAAAETYRKTKNRKLPQVLYRSECGAGGPVDVVLKPSPSGGTISMISEFQYELCKVEGGKQDDLNSCRGWRTVRSDGRVQVSGRYFISAKWPDKSSSPKRFDFSDAEEDAAYTIGQD